MIRTASALGLALAAALSVSAAQALELSPTCRALHGLADAARVGEPQRLALIVSSAGCERTTPGAATAAFCAAALGSPANVAVWEATECVSTMMADAQIFTGKTASGYRSKPVIERVAAKLGGGVRLDIKAAGDRYDLVVWKAN